MVSRAELLIMLLVVALVATNWHHIEDGLEFLNQPIVIQVNFPGAVYVAATPAAASVPPPNYVPVPAVAPAPAPTVVIQQPFVPIELTPAVAPACSCAADLYNCADFANRTDAEACFNQCVREGAGDIHNLDRDWDGLICESGFD